MQLLTPFSHHDVLGALLEPNCYSFQRVLKQDLFQAPAQQVCSPGNWCVPVFLKYMNTHTHIYSYMCKDIGSEALPIQS